LWNRHAARCHNHLPGTYGFGVRGNNKHISLSNHIAHLTRHAPGHLAGLALALKHLNNGFAGVVTEQLAAMLFVPGDAMAFDEIKEVARRIPCQGRTTEMGVLRNELRGRGANIGEIAAPTPRDTDFFGQAFGVVKQHNTQAALAGHRSGHHAGGTRTNDGNVEDRLGRHAGYSEKQGRRGARALAMQTTESGPASRAETTNMLIRLR